MIRYELSLTVDPLFLAPLIPFLSDEHIPRVLAMGYFIGAELIRSPGGLRVVYLAPSREVLDRFFSEKAMDVRAFFRARFPDGVTISRAIVEVVQSWS